MEISDGIKVIFLTAACYLLSYSYEIGYFRYFDLPTELIDINVKTLLTFGIVFMSILFVCIIPFVNIVSKIIFERKRLNLGCKFNFTYVAYGLLLANYVVFLIVFHHVMSIYAIIYQLVFILILAANDILIPYMYKQNLSLTESIDEHAEVQSQSNVLNLFARATNSKVHIYIITLIFLMSLAHIIGGLSAMSAKLSLTCNKFIIYETQGESVIVKLDANKYRVIAIDSCLLENISIKNQK